MLCCSLENLWLPADLAEDLVGDLPETVDICRLTMRQTSSDLRCRGTIADIFRLDDRGLPKLPLKTYGMLKSVHLQNDS